MAIGRATSHRLRRPEAESSASQIRLQLPVDHGPCDSHETASRNQHVRQTKKTKPTRVDHVVASPETLKYITAFNVWLDPAIPTHARLDITLTTPEHNTDEVNVQNKPLSLCERLQQQIEDAVWVQTESPCGGVVSGCVGEQASV